LEEYAGGTLWEEFRAGAPIRLLARRYGRTEQSIRRKITRARVRRIMQLPLEYIASPEFERPDASHKILVPVANLPSAHSKVRGPVQLESYLASLYEVPLLTAEQETTLFRRYNFLKYTAARLRSQLDPQRPKQRIVAQIEKCYDEAVVVKNQIIRANLRLVVSIVKRFAADKDLFFDLISEGNESLMRAVEKFDYTRGFKFSTYATWAIKKNHFRLHAVEVKRRDRFRSAPDELFNARPEYRANPYEELRAQKTREAQVGKILGRLPDRERRIIVSRFGLASGQEPKTLAEVAVEFGVSKERIRQLEVRAMNALREAALAENIEAPEAA
jgi:RNA polymerase primary sigma factor/RNA polymerase sigma factor